MSGIRGQPHIDVDVQLAQEYVELGRWADAECILSVLPLGVATSDLAARAELLLLEIHSQAWPIDRVDNLVRAKLVELSVKYPDVSLIAENIALLDKVED